MKNAAFTAAACRIARIERSKFNDAMASGEYTCAPSAQPGYPRIFELHDLIGLFLFARLIERGRTVKQAAFVTCQIVSQLKNAVHNGSEMPTHVGIAYDMIGNSYTARGEDVKPDASHAGAAIPVLWTEMWHVAALRAEVEKGLALEGRIAGSDSE